MNSVTASVAPPSTATALSADRDFKWAAAFVLLVVFEGVFGKWISPALEYPPVLLRDLLGIFIVYRAWTSGRLKQHPQLFSLLLGWSLLLASFAFVQALLLGQGFIVVAIGLRFWVLYLWVTLALCCTISWQDYHRLCKLLVTLMWLMLPLLVVQNRAGPEAWINKSSTEGAAIFTVAGDIVRTAGTFSFTLGFTCFLALLTPLLLSPLPQTGATGQQAARAGWLGMGLLVVAAVVSGSRGTMALTAFVVALALLASLAWRTRDAGAALAGAGIAAVVMVVLPAVLPGTLEAIEERVFAAHAAEDPVIRILNTVLGSPDAWAATSFLGEGLGLAANMSARLAGVAPTGTFVLAETEIDRVILAGGLVGLLWQAAKLGIVVAGLGPIGEHFGCGNHGDAIDRTGRDA